MLVAGAGVSGAAAAGALVGLEADVVVADDRAPDRGARPDRVVGGAPVRHLTTPPIGTSLVVTSPGWRPDSPLLTAAAAAGIEVIGEVELAWRLAHAGDAVPAPWLAVTGTNGKTTTVRMLADVLRADGRDAVATGNVGLPLVSAVGAGHEVLAVELSSFQLHWSCSLDPHIATVLNLAPDHLDWHGSLQAYADAKAKVLGPTTRAVVNLDDPASAALLERAGSRRATRGAVFFTLARPQQGQLGIESGALVDRAFGPGGGVQLIDVSELSVPGPHGTADALAAAALARSYGVPVGAVRAGLAGFRPDPHRHALVAELGGVRWVDDSKATNPHAAAASLAGLGSVVWIAGGLLKEAEVDDLVRSAAGRLRGVVLLGTDQQPFLQALARHAPDVPVRRVLRLDTGAMTDAVEHARALARPGDTVLLAPAAASMDCFRDYRERGELFAAGARLRPGGRA